jgi:transcriptional regulator with XRE-family HTH domain
MPWRTCFGNHECRTRTVGRRIAELRAQQGLTQEDFAELLSMSVERIQRIERGTNLTIASLCQLANALTCEVGKLFEQDIRPAKHFRPPWPASVFIPTAR